MALSEFQNENCYLIILVFLSVSESLLWQFYF